MFLQGSVASTARWHRSGLGSRALLCGALAPQGDGALPGRFSTLRVTHEMWVLTPGFLSDDTNMLVLWCKLEPVNTSPCKGSSIQKTTAPRASARHGYIYGGVRWCSLICWDFCLVTLKGAPLVTSRRSKKGGLHSISREGVKRQHNKSKSGH